MNHRTCPNCEDPVLTHSENGCILAALIGVVSDRGNTSAEKLQELHASCDVDELWHRLGPIIDDLEAGVFSEVA